MSEITQEQEYIDEWRELARPEEDKRMKKISNDQTPLAQALASVLNDLNGGQMYGSKPPTFDRVFGALKSAGLIVGNQGQPAVVNLTHPEPDVFDSRLEAMLRQAFVGVLGGEVEISIVEEINE